MEVSPFEAHVDNDALRLLHVGPLPPTWSGMGVHLKNFLVSVPICAQKNWVLNTSTEALPGNPNNQKLPTPDRMFRHFKLAEQVYRTVRANRIQLVHLNGSSHDLSFLGNLIIVVGAKLAGARVVWHLHEDLSVALFPGKKIYTQRLFLFSMRVSDALAVMTVKDKEIAALYIPSSKVVVLSPTCSPDFINLTIERSTGLFRVLYVGWLTKAKGIFDLLQVALKIKDLIPKIVFEILGTGMSDEDTKVVRDFVELHNMQDRVNLHGVVIGDAKQQQFADAQVLFTPTHWDAFPVSILEAMSAGLPVLGTKVGGLPVMLENGKGALLTDVGDIAGMVDSLVTLSKDERLRYCMGQANRERFVSLFHPDRVGSAALEIYSKLIN